MMDHTELYEMAARPTPTHPVPAEHGVAFFCGNENGMAEGALLGANRARQLGAQLILAADEHDAILEAT